MLKKILSACLLAFIFSAVSGFNVFARAVNDGESDRTVKVKQENRVETKDLNNVSKTERDSANNLGKTDYSRAEYERQKAKGRKFSTTTKVLIGVGIAAAVLGIVVFAASRDKIRTF